MNKIKSNKEIKLNKAISKQLEPFGITKAELSDGYYYNFSDASVEFKSVEDNISDDLFIDFVEDRFDYKCKYPFVLSLLHEVGHHSANDDIEGEVYDFCMREKKRIEKEMDKAETEEEIVKLSYQYFNLPDEIMATQWAINYAKRHPLKIREMQKACSLALLEFLSGE